MTTYITTVDELDRLIPIFRPEPGKPDKQLDHIDHYARAFIQRCPLVMLATSDAEDRLDVSPRGDPPGFVQVLDEHRILIPDRKGNHRLDTMRNVIANPRVGCLFLIPGRPDTLRVNGHAQITADSELLATCAVDGKIPVVAIVVEVEEVYFHCARSLLRAGAWEPDRWPDTTGLATLGQAIRDQMRLSQFTAEQIDADLAKVNCDLY